MIIIKEPANDDQRLFYAFRKIVIKFKITQNGKDS